MPRQRCCSGGSANRGCCTFPHNTHLRQKMSYTLILAVLALLCTFLSLDPYAAFMGSASVVVLATGTCTPLSAAGFVVSGILAWAAALMSAMSILSIVWTTVCDEEQNNTPPPMDNTTATVDSSDDYDENYEFFCTYKQVFLLLSILSAIFWAASGKLILSMSLQQHQRTARFVERDDDTVATEQDALEECLERNEQAQHDGDEEDYDGQERAIERSGTVDTTPPTTPRAEDTAL